MASKEEILAGLAEIVNEETGLDAAEVQPEKSFTDDLDIDSISMMTIVVNAEDKFGVKIPDVSLGSLIGSGANTITSAPWLFYFPAGVLTLLTVSMALVADGLRDAFDPTSAAGGRA